MGVNPKVFIGSIDVVNKLETKESTDAGSSGSSEPAFGGSITKREIYKIHNAKLHEEVEMDEATDSSSFSGGYDVPLFGKTLVFAVSQKHAARLTNILNKLALERWPETYGQSDFAMQVTSDVTGAQQMTINFANNVLSGKVKNPEGYESSKTRVAVTVGMMTTGYDCQDILNIALMRPVFSPSEFVQMKGRGTRKWSFDYNNYADIDESIPKVKFKFFDFFATCFSVLFWLEFCFDFDF
jgi:type I site-specific restriction endonuclease